MVYGKRRHSGGLHESLQTTKEITQDEFTTLLDSGKYEYYGYDSRVNQHLWLSLNKGIQYNWLFITDKIIMEWK